MRFHTDVRPSALPAASNPPSTATEKTESAGLEDSADHRQAPVAGSQSRTEPSQPVVASSARPSGEWWKATDQTISRCPEHTAKGRGFEAVDIGPTRYDMTENSRSRVARLDHDEGVNLRRPVSSRVVLVAFAALMAVGAGYLLSLELTAGGSVSGRLCIGAVLLSALFMAAFVLRQAVQRFQVGIGNAIGFYTDVRANGTYGALDNLRIVQGVPEPASLGLLMLGGLGFLRRRR